MVSRTSVYALYIALYVTNIEGRRDGSVGPFIKGTGYTNFAGAKAYCEDLGYELASIHSDEENLAASRACSSSCWIGGFSNDNTNEDFYWVDGTAWDYTNWDAGEPNDWADSEDCVEMVHTGLWNDNSCSKAFQPMCRTDEGILFVDLYAVHFDWSQNHRVTLCTVLRL